MTEMGLSRRQLALASVAVAVCALLVRVPVLETVQFYWEDSYWFCLLARSLEEGSYSIGGLPHARFFPGYPLALAGVDLATGSAFPLPRVAAWLSAVTGSIAVGLCLPLFRLWGLSTFGAALGILGLLLCPAMSLYGGLPFYESFFLLFVVLTLLGEALGHGRLAAVCAGLATVTKPEGAFLVLGLALAAPGWKEGVVRLVIGGLPVAPWLLRNWIVLGGPMSTEYKSIYEGFQASGTMWSGLAYLRHYAHFFSPIVLLVAAPSVRKLAVSPTAVSFGLGALALHLVWPGDLERYVLPHAPLIFFLFAATLQTIGSTRERLTLGGTVTVLGLLLALQLPDRIFAEATRSAAYGSAAMHLGDKTGEFTVLGPDHAALQVLSRRFAFSAWQDLSRPAAEMVADLVRRKNLRYQLVTNYFNIDKRFRFLQSGGELAYPLRDGSRLIYRPAALMISPFASAEPEMLGLHLRLEKLLYQVIVYELKLEPPDELHRASHR